MSNKLKILGIYKIINIINGKFYIGKSIDINNRFIEHKKELNNNTHPNRFMQVDWNQHGEQNFKFEIIEECSKDKLTEREQHHLDKLKSWDRNFGYNIMKMTSSTMTNKHHTEESKLKMSQTKKQRIKEGMYKENYSKAMKKRKIVWGQNMRIPLDINKIVELRKQGYGYEAIGKMMGCSETPISDRLKEYEKKYGKIIMKNGYNYKH